MEDTILKGDFIIMEECDVSKLQKGDIIAFFATEQDQVIIKTHRIVEITEGAGGRSFITRGDNNDADDYVPVFPSDIIGKWNGTRIAHVGSILDFVSSQIGFLICIILPLFALFIYQIYRFIVVIIEEKNNATGSKNKEKKNKEKKIINTIVAIEYLSISFFEVHFTFETSLITDLNQFPIFLNNPSFFTFFTSFFCTFFVATFLLFFLLSTSFFALVFFDSFTIFIPYLI